MHLFRDFVPARTSQPHAARRSSCWKFGLGKGLVGAPGLLQSGAYHCLRQRSPISGGNEAPRGHCRYCYGSHHLALLLLPSFAYMTKNLCAGSFWFGRVQSRTGFKMRKVPFRRQFGYDISPHCPQACDTAAICYQTCNSRGVGEAIMGKLPVEGGSKGPGGQHGSRLGTRLGSRAFSARGGQGLGSAASLSTADEKTRRISRQHISKGPHSAVPVATPSLDEGRGNIDAVKSLFKPYRVSILCVLTCCQGSCFSERCRLDHVDHK